MSFVESFRNIPRHVIRSHPLRAVLLATVLMAALPQEVKGQPVETPPITPGGLIPRPRDGIGAGLPDHSRASQLLGEVNTVALPEHPPASASLAPESRLSPVENKTENLKNARKPLQDLEIVIKTALSEDYQDPTLRRLALDGSFSEIAEYQAGARITRPDGEEVWQLKLGGNDDKAIFQVAVHTEADGSVSGGDVVGRVPQETLQHYTNPGGYVRLDELLTRIGKLPQSTQLSELTPGGILGLGQDEQDIVFQALGTINGDVQVAVRTRNYTGANPIYLNPSTPRTFQAFLPSS